MRKDGDALAVSLTPQTRQLKHRAGQFVFVSFPGVGMSEPHPFTLSSAPDPDGALRISVAPLGDYTRRLMSRIAVGIDAHVEGPFGDFTLPRGPQVWVAAGIGITPFAAMAGTLTPDDGPVVLIYSVRNRSKAAHLSELEADAKANPGFTLILRETANEGRLDADVVLGHLDDLKGTTVLYCGPVDLRKTLQQGLRRAGLPVRRFRYEAFEIRTGVGLRYLFRYLTDRR